MNDQDLFAELIAAARNPDGARLVVARYGAGWRIGLSVPHYAGLGALPGAKPVGWALAGWLADQDDGPRHHTLEQAAAIAIHWKADALEVPTLQGWADRITIVLDDEPPAAIVV